MRFRVIGAGRAGRSFQSALTEQGWSCIATLGREDDPIDAAQDVDVVIVAVPDDAIAAVANRISPGQATLVHLSGAKTLAVLAPHEHRGSVHPLVSLPDSKVGAERLLSGATFAVAGDRLAAQIVAILGGKPIEVSEERRATYHAAASVAANHLVALCAQVERLANQAGVAPESYWELMTLTLENVAQVGAHAALTGPAARGDLATIQDHLEAIGPDEAQLYLVLADAAADIAGQPRPGAVSPRSKP